MKPLVAVDIDNVLGATAEMIADFSNKTWGTDLDATHFNEDFSVMWGVSSQEAVKRVAYLYQSDIFAHISPIDDAFTVLSMLKDQYRFVTLSSRLSSVATLTRQWLDRYYPGIFVEQYYSGIYDVSDTQKTSRVAHTKGESAHAVGAICLVDDEPKHCLGAQQYGIDAVLFGNYRWNNQHLEAIHTCRSWVELGEFLKHYER